jgi:hypothetical protein
VALRRFPVAHTVCGVRRAILPGGFLGVRVMTLGDFLVAAKAFSALGDAVGDQLRAVLDGQPMADQNSNALVLLARFLRDIDGDVEDEGDWADEIDAFLEADAAEGA